MKLEGIDIVALEDHNQVDEIYEPMLPCRLYMGLDKYCGYVMHFSTKILSRSCKNSLESRKRW